MSPCATPISEAPCAFLVQLRVQPTAARLNPAEVRLLCRHPTAVQAHCCCAVGWSLQPTWAWKLRMILDFVLLPAVGRIKERQKQPGKPMGSSPYTRESSTPCISPIKYIWKWGELYTSVSILLKTSPCILSKLNPIRHWDWNRSRPACPMSALSWVHRTRPAKIHDLNLSLPASQNTGQETKMFCQYLLL